MKRHFFHSVSYVALYTFSYSLKINTFIPCEPASLMGVGTESNLQRNRTKKIVDGKLNIFTLKKGRNKQRQETCRAQAAEDNIKI